MKKLKHSRARRASVTANSPHRHCGNSLEPQANSR
jgi:hypothetical protein